MKFSIDIDNTLTKHPEFFASLVQFAKQNGHEVGILSGRAPQDIPQGPWDFIIGCPMGAPYTDEHQKQREWKAPMIKLHGIDVHFDDMAEWILEGDVGGAKVVKIT